MKVGIIQSSYIPWRGYFDFIDSVDLFILFDDVAYSKGSWRNRNRIKTASGLKWLTVPVRTRTGVPIDQVLICDTSYRRSWQRRHRNLLRSALEPAPYFKDALEIWEEGVSAGHTRLSRLNLGLIKLICAYLGIKTPIALSRDYEAAGSGTERVINLLRKVGATVYLCGPSARAYLDETLFEKHGIGLQYKRYDYRPYPQLWGGFEGAVTVLDLIANCGPGSRRYLKSQSPDEVVVG